MTSDNLPSVRQLLVSVGVGVGVAYVGSVVVGKLTKLIKCQDLYEIENISESDLKPADHIFIPGCRSGGSKMSGSVMYFHHGIYLGDGLVTDFGVTDNNTPIIRNLNEFLNGFPNKLQRRNYKVGANILDPDASKQLAYKICRGELPWPKFHLNNNNCEHYASFVKMGQPLSEQAIELPRLHSGNNELVK